MAKQRYYVIWKGRKTGVFSNWDDCSKQVTGFAGAQYKSFDTLDAAQAAFAGQYSSYVTKSTGTPAPAAPREELLVRLKRLADTKKIQTPSYAVDAACEGNPGVLEYRGVDLSNGEIVFARGPFQQGTNNIGEFLALVEAIQICAEKRLTIPIYSDSKIAISWVREGKCKTNLERNKRNSELFDLIARAEAWLESNTYSNRIIKWETEDWGENPADYGRK